MWLPRTTLGWDRVAWVCFVSVAGHFLVSDAVCKRMLRLCRMMSPLLWSWDTSQGLVACDSASHMPVMPPFAAFLFMSHSRFSHCQSHPPLTGHFRYQLKLRLFKPKSASMLQTFASWMSGMPAEFSDPRFPSYGEGREGVYIS